MKAFLVVALLAVSVAWASGAACVDNAECANLSADLCDGSVEDLMRKSCPNKCGRTDCRKRATEEYNEYLRELTELKTKYEVIREVECIGTTSCCDSDKDQCPGWAEASQNMCNAFPDQCCKSCKDIYGKRGGKRELLKELLEMLAQKK